MATSSTALTRSSSNPPANSFSTKLPRASTMAMSSNLGNSSPSNRSPRPFQNRMELSSNSLWPISTAMKVKWVNQLRRALTWSRDNLFTRPLRVDSIAEIPPTLREPPLARDPQPSEDTGCSRRSLFTPATSSTKPWLRWSRARTESFSHWWTLATFRPQRSKISSWTLQ